MMCASQWKDIQLKIWMLAEEEEARMGGVHSVGPHQVIFNGNI